LNKSESFLSLILSSLKEMSSARANRHVDNYMKEAGRISKAYNPYHQSFKEFYKKHVENFLNKIELTPTEQVENKQIINQKSPMVVDVEQLDPATNKRPDVSAVPITQDEKLPITQDDESIATSPNTPAPGVVSNSLPFQPTMPSANEVDKKVTLPNMSAPKVPDISDTNPAPPPVHLSEPPEGEFKSDQIAKELFGPKAAHQKFYRSLESMQGEDPIILAKFISKYAKSIQKTDLATAVQLFKIAKNIKG
jgi:hypothetical protein